MARVHVVGAGPAGSVAAISALRNNHGVVISEEHPTAGIPLNCSGLFSCDGLETLRDLFDYRRTVINPIYGADIYFGEHRLSVSRDAPVGMVCDRSAFDRRLAEVAEQEGAEIRYGERVESSFCSEIVIGADGPSSSVARNFGFPRIPAYACTLHAMAEYHSEDHHRVEVYISNSRFPGFFAWVIPHDEYTAELGVGVAAPNSVSRAWENLLSLKKVKPMEKPKGHAIPISMRRSSSAGRGKRKVLLVGDAAGQVKATTGGGVVFGSNCARIAGCYADSPGRYELEWRLRFGADLYAHHLVRSYLAGLDDNAVADLGKRLKKLNCDVFLSDYGHMDRPIQMIRPEMVIHLLKNIAGVAFDARQG
ncbi:hypothetical protein GF318_04670 [Candidatus Micrarchaeota archaeon]|nr:hypothetical protein [Candidatus Micrarchaeota archaeon]